MTIAKQLSVDVSTVTPEIKFEVHTPSSKVMRYH